MKTKTKNYYHQVIEAIMNPEVHSEDLIREIAKHNPAALVKAYNKLRPEPVYVAQCRELVKADAKITAVKLWRDNNPGCGLGEAKLAVERL